MHANQTLTSLVHLRAVIRLQNKPLHASYVSNVLVTQCTFRGADLVSIEQNLNDRKLGHEWYGWDGNIDAHEAFIYEPKRLFMGMLFSVFFLAFACLCLLVWGVYPRLTSAAGWLGPAVLSSMAVLTAGFLFLYGSVLYVLVSKRPFAIAETVVHRFFLIFPLIAGFSKRFGISKDRLGYSLLEIHNEVMRSRLRKVSSGRILCLAPRCLDKKNIEQMKALMAEYDCDFYVAPTGAQARQRIVQIRPSAIIGIACERDLITGIRDVGYRIPVIGVANKRPLGPCKGAFIDLTELREAIEVFKDRFEFCPAAAEESVASPASE